MKHTLAVIGTVALKMVLKLFLTLLWAAFFVQALPIYEPPTSLPLPWPPPPDYIVGCEPGMLPPVPGLLD